jgi:O-antigen biosynthesis protein
MKTKLLIIGHQWPEPQSSAAGTRMMQLISYFKMQGFDITFATTASDTSFGVALDKIGIHTQNILLNDTSFDEFILKLQPDVVVFDRFMTEEQFGWRVAEHLPNTIRILDTEDLHFLRQARAESLKKGKPLDLHTPLAKREIAAILRSDMSLIISSFEMKLLIQDYKIDPQLLYYLPIGITLSPENLTSIIPFEARKDFVFIGNFKHEPNWDAVLHLKKDIWPGLRIALPEAKLHIYGAYPSQKVTDLHHTKSGFLIHGRAESAANVIAEARVMLAPLRFGAGIKGKLLEAMVQGTPSITFPVGAEGLCFDDVWNGVVASKSDDFIAAAIATYQQQEQWEAYQKVGFEIVRKHFDDQELAVGFNTRIQDLLQNFELYRQQNFMGSLLWHHTTLTTKYMALWIAAKNKP